MVGVRQLLAPHLTLEAGLLIAEALLAGILGFLGQTYITSPSNRLGAAHLVSAVLTTPDSPPAWRRLALRWASRPARR